MSAIKTTAVFLLVSILLLCVAVSCPSESARGLVVVCVLFAVNVGMICRVVRK
jgi:hypothetical protein